MVDEGIIYRLLFENSGQGMVLQQGEKIILVNQSFADMVGYGIDELLDFSMEEALNLFDPQDRELVTARFSDLLVREELPKSQIYRFIRRNGETGWWSSTVTLVEYEGQPAVLGV